MDAVVRSVAPASSTGSAASLLPQVTSDAGDALSDISKQLDGLVTATQAQSEITAANTLALSQSTATQSSGGAGATASTIGNLASSFLGGSIVPLISGLIDLFSGGGSDQPTTLTRYAPPPSLNFDAANGPLDSSAAGLGLQGVSYDQSGQPRTGASASTAQSITIQVQAMDSQSFLDHSQDIADAVRQAMLNMHPLNDLVSDL
jgi:hypothetical protein